MDVLVLIGRIRFSSLFIASGTTHLTQTKAWAGYAASKRLPSPAAAVALSGVLILAGGLSVLLGIWADLGMLLLIVFLVPTTLIMHRFWAERDAMMHQVDRAMFMKNTALAGAALALLAFFAYAGHDLGLTLTGPLFDLR